MIRAAVLAAMLSAVIPVHDYETPFTAWFMSLKQPDNPNASCCGPADQFYVDEYYPSRKDPGGFVALVNNQWIEVPAKKVIWDQVNPTGRGVIFITNQGYEGTGEPYVYCFVPGVGA